MIADLFLIREIGLMCKEILKLALWEIGIIAILLLPIDIIQQILQLDLHLA